MELQISHSFCTQIPSSSDIQANINGYRVNKEDIAADQISIKEFNDPFTGEPVTKGK